MFQPQIQQYINLAVIKGMMVNWLRDQFNISEKDRVSCSVIASDLALAVRNSPKFQRRNR
jgi:hypothetical protein